MNNQQFAAIAQEIFDGLAESNLVLLPEENVTVPVLEAPIIGFAAADDPIFDTFRDPVINGENWLGPRERMPEAKTVAVFYFSFTEEIRSRHRASREIMDDSKLLDLRRKPEAFIAGYHRTRELYGAALLGGAMKEERGSSKKEQSPRASMKKMVSEALLDERGTNYY